ncbi:glycosyl transferase group 1 [Catenulispora acidiphila DSM 44928]|uniref:Glycosyl transferase group 1 n=1 Tax=Catenulispora acidiphila (strain DSM 44928 / JCM 14897 / NBRC 102108 / NRRL B-24433 / ID139908) TaxID=479433 RepID=C7PWH4_CATAD|nr:glycosyltransferase family 4 protein [Catenulispora acidiphila]ACU75254.1 glycosyl transferase group 1 [Catenulispora acidiphila DSM 44928]
MRILHIVNLGFEAGGAEKFVRMLRDGQTARGHQVRVVALEAPAGGRTVFADDLVPPVGGGPIGKLAGFVWHRGAHREVRRIMREFQPDCVHMHTIGGFSPAVFPATRGTARILTIHGPEDWTRKLLRWQVADNSGRIAPAALPRYLHLRLLMRPAYRLLGLRRIDGFAAPSRFVAGLIAADAGRVPVRVIPYAVDQAFTPAPVTEVWQTAYVGRLSPLKGADVLLEAFDILARTQPKARLVVVGDGPDRERLQARAAHLVAAGTVEFRGWLSPPEVAECLRGSALLAVPSTTPEIFGLTALEALELGRPLVASRIGALPELVGPDNGVLVAPGDAAALAEALAGLVGDAERLARLAEGSARRAEAFSLDRCLDEYEAWYREAAAAHGHP